MNIRSTRILYIWRFIPIQERRWWWWRCCLSLSRRSLHRSRSLRVRQRRRQKDKMEETKNKEHRDRIPHLTLLARARHHLVKLDRGLSASIV